MNTGDLTGNNPTQQPTEGVNTGLNMGTMIEVELPKVIVNISTTCMGVESHTCLQEAMVVLQTDSTIYK